MKEEIKKNDWVRHIVTGKIGVVTKIQREIIYTNVQCNEWYFVTVYYVYTNQGTISDEPGNFQKIDPHNSHLTREVSRLCALLNIDDETDANSKLRHRYDASNFCDHKSSTMNRYN